MPIERNIPPLSSVVVECYRIRIEDLLGEYRQAGEAKVFAPTPEARDALDGYYDSIVERRRTGELEDLGVFAARWAEWAWEERREYVRKLLAKHPEGFTAHTLKRAKVFGDPMETLKTLEGLVRHSYLVHKTPTAGRGQPTVTYRAGPKL